MALTPCVQDIKIALANDRDLARIVVRYITSHPKLKNMLGSVATALASTADKYIVDSNGMFRTPSSVLKTMPGFEGRDESFYVDEYLRQMGPGQVDDEGNDISYLFVCRDVGKALLFNNPANASRWTRNVKLFNKKNAPSLTYIKSGNNNVSLCRFVFLLLIFILVLFLVTRT